MKEPHLMVYTVHAKQPWRNLDCFVHISISPTQVCKGVTWRTYSKRLLEPISRVSDFVDLEKGPRISVSMGHWHSWPRDHTCSTTGLHNLTAGKWWWAPKVSTMQESVQVIPNRMIQNFISTEFVYGSVRNQTDSTNAVHFPFKKPLYFFSLLFSHYDIHSSCSTGAPLLSPPTETQLWSITKKSSKIPHSSQNTFIILGSHNNLVHHFWGT